MADLQVTAVVVCDDIRKEVTGKDILIGVYSGDILVPDLPMVINAAFWIELGPNQPGNYKLNMRVRLGNKVEALPIAIELQIADTSQSAVFTPQATIAVDTATELLLERRVGDSWETLKSKKIYKGVTVQPFSASTFSEPPSSQS